MPWERKPPFSPDAVTNEFCELLKAYWLTKVSGDRYGGEWPRERFRAHGITYELADKAKSEIYGALLPILNSGNAELLDLPRLTAQLIGLERRTARSGRDSVDHAPGGHDDIANAVGGALVLAAAVKAPLIITPEILAQAKAAAVTKQRGARDGAELTDEVFLLNHQRNKVATTMTKISMPSPTGTNRSGAFLEGKAAQVVAAGRRKSGAAYDARRGLARDDMFAAPHEDILASLQALQENLQLHLDPEAYEQQKNSHDRDGARPGVGEGEPRRPQRCHGGERCHG